VSAARPRIADYPFTTLVPNLGVVRVDPSTSFVLADVPGLIEGAHLGAGLGTRFLRHLSRTAVLVHVLDLGAPDRDPQADYETIERELSLADPALAAKPRIVAGNKIDLVEARDRLPALANAFARRGIELLPISAATGTGLPQLVRRIASALDALRRTAPFTEPPPGVRSSDGA
jgi:GTP-binding protein